jgi:hypothetical protein
LALEIGSRRDSPFVPASHKLSSRIGFHPEAQDALESALKVNPILA